jgi:hypothetical protein
MRATLQSEEAEQKKGRACTFADKRDMAVKNECKKCYIRRNLFGFASALKARRQFRPCIFRRRARITERFGRLARRRARRESKVAIP